MPSTGVRQTHSSSTMQNSSANDCRELKLVKSKNVSFHMVTERNYAIWIRVPAWVLILGTDKWKPDEQSSLSLDARESMENRYVGSLEESVW